MTLACDSSKRAGGLRGTEGAGGQLPPPPEFLSISFLPHPNVGHHQGRGGSSESQEKKKLHKKFESV